MRGPFSRAGEVYNWIEVGLWPALGLAVALRSLRRSGPARVRGLLAAVTLFAFGASDWAENETGGEWWHPWWLLLWKAACVVTLLTLGIRTARSNRSASTSPAPGKVDPGS